MPTIKTTTKIKMEEGYQPVKNNGYKPDKGQKPAPPKPASSSKK